MNSTLLPFKLPDRIYGGYIFDLDGTIYLGGEVLPGVLTLMRSLRSARREIVFLSNNPTRDHGQYLEKLRALGIDAQSKEVITTVDTTSDWILRNAPGAVVFPIAEEPLIRGLQKRGIEISEDPGRIDIVVASYDRTLTWKKLQIAFEAIWYHRRARLIATNPDRFCPFPEGRGEVDAGAVIAALEHVCGTTVEVNCGKPGNVMIDTILASRKLSRDQWLLTGDRLSTDIQMGINSDIDTALVFTGETSREMLAQTPTVQRPQWNVERIDQIFPRHVQS